MYIVVVGSSKCGDRNYDNTLQMRQLSEYGNGCLVHKWNRKLINGPGRHYFNVLLA